MDITYAPMETHLKIKIHYVTEKITKEPPKIYEREINKGKISITPKIYEYHIFSKVCCKIK